MAIHYSIVKNLFLPLTFTLLIINGFAQTAPGIQWSKCYGGTDSDSPSSIIKTNDGGFIMSGMSSSQIAGHHGSYLFSDVYIVKIDSSGTVQWDKSFGGTSDENCYSIIETHDNYYVFAGITKSNNGDVSGNHGFYDYWVVKIDSVGNIIWQKCFGGSDYESASSLIETSDHHLVIVGIAASNDSDVVGNHGMDDVWIIKLDSAGNSIWKKTYGGSLSDRAYSIVESNNGGYVFAGTTSSTNGDVTSNHGGGDGWIAKIDTAGNLIWQKCLGGTESELFISIINTFNGGYAIAGRSGSNNGDVSLHYGSPSTSDIWLINADSIGSILWEKSFGGTQDDMVFSLIQSTDKGFLLSGETESNDFNVTGNHGLIDSWILKIDSSSNLIWQKCIGGSYIDAARSTVIATDNSYLSLIETSSHDSDITCNHTSWANIQDYFLVKFFPESTTGINTIPTINSFSVYPNPFNEELAISSLHPELNREAKKKMEIKIYNVFGEEVLSQTCTTANCRLKTANLSKGVFFIKVDDQVKKVVKM